MHSGADSMKIDLDAVVPSLAKREPEIGADEP
jgi:hypothetical protein